MINLHNIMEIRIREYYTSYDMLQIPTWVTGPSLADTRTMINHLHNIIEIRVREYTFNVLSQMSVTPRQAWAAWLAL